MYGNPCKIRAACSLLVHARRWTSVIPELAIVVTAYVIVRLVHMLDRPDVGNMMKLWTALALVVVLVATGHASCLLTELMPGTR
jgi:hypothetical protein